MATIAERILDAIRFGPLDDDVLAKRLGVAQRQSINQVARRLEADGRLRRYIGPDGKLVNELVGGGSGSYSPVDHSPRPPQVRHGAAPEVMPEDDVKRAVGDHLKRHGFDVQIAWGRERGIDIDARHGDGRRFVIEAKGAVGRGPQQVSYFLGVIGELVQRMSDPTAVHALALPENQQYLRLCERLPGLARRRLGLAVFWVGADGHVRFEDLATQPG